MSDKDPKMKSFRMTMKSKYIFWSETLNLRKKAISDRETGDGRWWTLFRILKWIPVGMHMSTILYSYYAIVVLLVVNRISDWDSKISTLIVYHVALIIFMWAYLQTMFASTHNKNALKKFKLPKDVIEKIYYSTSDNETSCILNEHTKNENLTIQTRNGSNHLRYCEDCQILKPDRAHHCSVCGHCVLKMDHHCQWINNCVSFDNLKFFVLFVVYEALYWFVIFCLTFHHIFEIWLDEWSGRPEDKYPILSVFLVGGLFTITIGMFGIYYCHMICKNRTLLETMRATIFIDGPDWDGFDQGAFNNFKQVFGNNPLTWFLPIFTSLGDGTNYPSKHLGKEKSEDVGSGDVGYQNCPVVKVDKIVTDQPKQNVWTIDDFENENYMW